MKKVSDCCGADVKHKKEDFEIGHLSLAPVFFCNGCKKPCKPITQEEFFTRPVNESV